MITREFHMRNIQTCVASMESRDGVLAIKEALCFSLTAQGSIASKKRQTIVSANFRS